MSGGTVHTSGGAALIHDRAHGCGGVTREVYRTRVIAIGRVGYVRDCSLAKARTVVKPEKPVVSYLAGSGIGSTKKIKAPTTYADPPNVDRRISGR